MQSSGRQGPHAADGLDARAHPRRTARPRRLAMALAAAAVAVLAFSGAATAQVPNQVTGLTAVQRDGFTTLAWSPAISISPATRGSESRKYP